MTHRFDDGQGHPEEDSWRVALRGATETDSSIARGRERSTPSLSADFRAMSAPRRRVRGSDRRTNLLAGPGVEQFWI